MPELRPFRGIRYQSSGDLQDLVCPPYDVISDDEQVWLHERHPHNAVRLELAQTKGEGAAKYRDAAETFGRWMEEGVLAPDPTPSFYVYRQDFTPPGGSRSRVAGVIGALELEKFGSEAGVLPHERTMAGPKADRMALLEAMQVNISPIYAIYRGAGGLAPFFDALEHRPPAARFQDEVGILHRLWAIGAPAEVTMLSEALRPGPLVIADGHHRYETALAYHESRAGTAGDHGATMCFCVDADAEDLVVLPYNRAVMADQPAEETVLRLTELGAITATDAEGAAAALASSEADHPFLFVTEAGTFTLEVSAGAVEQVVGDRAAAWRALDVVALHEVVLPRVFGSVTDLRFSKEPEEIQRLVREEGWSAGVLLRSLAAPQIVAVASSGERMPQKASYFWPKAITGMVFRSLR